MEGVVGDFIQIFEDKPSVINWILTGDREPKFAPTKDSSDEIDRTTMSEKVKYLTKFGVENPVELLALFGNDHEKALHHLLEYKHSIKASPSEAGLSNNVHGGTVGASKLPKDAKSTLLDAEQKCSGPLSSAASKIKTSPTETKTSLSRKPVGTMLQLPDSATPPPTQRQSVDR